MPRFTNKEIEIKLKFKNKTAIVKTLGSTAKFQNKKEIHDLYFGTKAKDMRNRNTLLRLRTIGRDFNELTLKGKSHGHGNIWHRVELTSQISSPLAIAKMLSFLGYQKISEYKSTREYWTYHGLKIDFIEFTKPAPLIFMEIEGPSNQAIKKTLAKLNGLVTEAGEEIFKIFDKKRKA